MELFNKIVVDIRYLAFGVSILSSSECYIGSSICVAGEVFYQLRTRFVPSLDIRIVADRYRWSGARQLERARRVYHPLSMSDIFTFMTPNS